MVNDRPPMAPPMKTIPMALPRFFMNHRETTVLAPIPMAFFGGQGGGANAALSRTILGGVAAATVLTLLVMPALYCLLARREVSKEVELEL